MNSPSPFGHPSLFRRAEAGGELDRASGRKPGWTGL